MLRARRRLYARALTEHERTMKTVGPFSMEEGILAGPREYMEEQGHALVDKILAGEDAIFNLTADQSPDVESAILVRLQTDYAGWLGYKQTERWFDSRDGHRRPSARGI